MKVRELEKLMSSDDTIEEALESIAKDMETVDKWCNTSVSELNDNTSEIKKALDELSKAYGNIRIVLGVAETKYRNEEVEYYESLKIQAEADDQKFVSAKADREASLHVKEYRRIRNLTQAYEQSCSKRIVVLQSILKDINKEYNSSQE